MAVVTYQLTPGELGQFVLTQVYASIAVGAVNFGLLIGYERNFFIYEKSITQSAQLISSALFFVLTNLLLLLFIVYLYQIEISKLVLSNDAPTNLLFIVLIATSISSLSQYYLTFFKNSGFAKRYVQFMIFQTGSYFFVAILLLFMSSLKVLSLAYALLISNALTFIFLVMALSKRLPPIFNKAMLKDMLKISLPLTPRVFFGLLSTQFDKIMLGLIGSTEWVGIYSVGQKFSSTIFQFMNGLGRVFQPELYRKLFSNKHQSKTDEIHNFIMPYFYLSIFIALLVAIFAKEFMSIFLAKEYFDASIITSILSVYYASFFFGKIVGNQLIYAKKTFTITFLTLAGIILNVGLNIPFIINWGIYGAAWATTISSILITCISYVVAQRYVKIIWQWRTIWLIYSVLIFGVVFTLIDYSEVTKISSYMSIIVKFIFIFIYIALGFKVNILTKARMQGLKVYMLTQARMQKFI